MEKQTKETCKTCAQSSPTYKGILCQRTGKKVKTTGTCEEWRAK